VDVDHLKKTFTENSTAWVRPTSSNSHSDPRILGQCSSFCANNRSHVASNRGQNSVVGRRLVSSGPSALL